MACRAALQIVAHVVADGDLEALGAGGAQVDVVDGDGRGAARAVRRDRRRGPVRRLGHLGAREAQMRRFLVNDHAATVYARLSARYTAPRASARTWRSCPARD